MDLILPVYVTCISITLDLVDTFENQRIMAGGYIYADRLGFLQCKRLCCRYGGCGAVSYLKEHCLCELHDLNSRQSNMSGDRGSVTWIKNASDTDSCRECRPSCQEEEQCLFTRRGKFKCVPAKRYFANEMRLTSTRIPTNVKCEYLESWGPSKEQICGKHNDKYPRNVTNVSLGDEKITVYYMLIHVQRNETMFSSYRQGPQGPRAFVPFFSVECYTRPILMISANKNIIKMYRQGDRSEPHPYPSRLIAELKMDIIPSTMDYFCLQTSRHVALSSSCGFGVSSTLLPFEETKQYVRILKNALSACLHEKGSGNK